MSLLGAIGVSACVYGNGPKAGHQQPAWDNSISTVVSDAYEGLDRSFNAAATYAVVAGLFNQYIMYRVSYISVTLSPLHFIQQCIFIWSCGSILCSTRSHPSRWKHLRSSRSNFQWMKTSVFRHIKFMFTIRHEPCSGWNRSVFCCIWERILLKLSQWWSDECRQL